MGALTPTAYRSNCFALCAFACMQCASRLLVNKWAGGLHTHSYLAGALALQGERIIQVVKRKTKFRSTTHPVKVLVNELQLILGIERLR